MFQKYIPIHNNASVLDLLNFILRTRLPAHAHHHDALHRQTPYVLDLWSEQYPSDIVASKNGADDTNLPETWTKAENLLDLDLDIFIRFGHSVWMARHGRVKLAELAGRPV